jgi:hypothetical protein
MNKSALKKLLLKSAEEHIDRLIDGQLKTTPISDWEANIIGTAIQDEAISITEGCFKLLDRSWAIWTLNREYWTHICAYLDLIMSKKYSAPNIKVEQSYMDLVVYENEVPKIAIEIKVKDKEAENLVNKIMSISMNPNLKQNDRGNDPLRKTKSILELRPEEFWVITPNKKWMFSVTFNNNGFYLTKIDHYEAAA